MWKPVFKWNHFDNHWRSFFPLKNLVYLEAFLWYQPPGHPMAISPWQENMATVTNTLGSHQGDDLGHVGGAPSSILSPVTMVTH